MASLLAAFFASIRSSSSSAPALLVARFLPVEPSSSSPSSSSFTPGTLGRVPLMLRLSPSPGRLGTPDHASPFGPCEFARDARRCAGCVSRPNRESPPLPSIARMSGRTDSSVASVRRSASISRTTNSRRAYLMSAAVLSNHFRCSCSSVAVTRCDFWRRYVS